MATVGALLLGAYAIHPWLLRGLSGLLVDDDPPQPASCVCLLLSSGLRQSELQSTADLLSSGQAERILLVDCRAPRSVRIGAAIPLTELARVELEKLGAPAQAIEVLPTDADTVADSLRALNDSLQDEPVGAVLVVETRFRTAQVREFVDQVVPPSSASQFRVIAVPDTAFDESYWWRSSTGVKTVAEGLLRRIHFWVWGEDVYVRDSWDPDQYEAGLP